ncbi:MAG: 8-oxo-dGTP diphosphatase MutT [Bacillota bacterium]|nr:8-oxo-dGTP diphosphatase MutT [Bacillota bacterium]
MKEVTAAIIKKGDKILIAKRAQGEKLAGKWEFPGGKIENGETPVECIKREIREELDVEIEVLKFYHESSYSYEHGEIKLLAYLCRLVSGDFLLKVHSCIEWINVKNFNINSYDFAPADISILNKLMSEADG